MTLAQGKHLRSIIMWSVCFYTFPEHLIMVTMKTGEQANRTSSLTPCSLSISPDLNHLQRAGLAEHQCMGWPTFLFNISSQSGGICFVTGDYKQAVVWLWLGTCHFSSRHAYWRWQYPVWGTLQWGEWPCLDLLVFSFWWEEDCFSNSPEWSFYS